MGLFLPLSHRPLISVVSALCWFLRRVLGVLFCYAVTPIGGFRVYKGAFHTAV